MEGDVGAAFENLMQANTDKGVEAAGVYGSPAQPTYMFMVFDPEVGAVDGKTFLRLTAEVGGYDLSPNFVTGHDGDTEVTCAAMEAPGVSGICFITGDQPAMAMSMRTTPDQQMVQDLLAAT